MFWSDLKREKEEDRKMKKQVVSMQRTALSPYQEATEESYFSWPLLYRSE